jgi:hypothetical protein
MKPSSKAIIMLCEEGFERIGEFLGCDILGITRKNDDEYIRFFAPQIISNRGRRSLVGVIGSMQASAQKKWDKIERLSEYFIVSLYSANFPSLRSPPTFGQSEEEDRRWCRAIATVACQFPSGYAELELLIAAKGEIAGLTLDRLDT